MNSKIAKSKKVIIAGGGIGGLTTAIALRRNGADVEIYEKTDQLRERGAAILLWPNATLVLRNLGVLDALIEKSDVVTHCEIRSWKGRLIKHWTIPKLSTPAIFIHRADLQATLLNSLPSETVHLGHPLESFSQDEENVRVYFSSNRVAAGDALIGADGLHSCTRDRLFGKQDPVYQGYTQWTAILNTAHKALKPGLKMEWWGRGIRFGIAANGCGRMNWYLSVNRQTLETSVVEKDRLLEWVHNWQEPVSEIIQKTLEEDIIQINIWDRPPSDAWGCGRVTLLGDAAHPTSPNLGQGAGMAIEDAYCLATFFESSMSVPEAFRAYEKARWKRTSTTTFRSQLVGRMGQWSHPAAIALRTFFLKSIPTALLERQLRSSYTFQV